MKNLIIIFAALYVVFRLIKNRYRLLNTILGNNTVRRLLVQFTMNIPYVRERFLKQAFR
ncbi:hypothetical protein ACFSCX_08200 [Bacillus salitolerans]|uniref:Sodium:proton antiporter n=1 Tax=Bacillus salitolerans TaxID=1437434 RepID=A0ABW4LMZ9_9BACI